jgi:protein-S-isoprenylcysteine O-methyltransferase Ste14
MIKTILVAMLLAWAGSHFIEVGPATQPHPDSGDVFYYLPGRWADFCRVVVIAQAGLALGFLYRILHYFFTVKKDDKDELLGPTVMICLVYFGMMLYIGVDIATRVDFTVKHPEYLSYLTWRTPLAFLLFSISDVSLYRLMKRVARMLGSRDRNDSIVKMTLTETKKGGTSVDLGSGDIVLPK